MALTPRFNLNAIDGLMQQAESQYKERAIRILRFVGEKAVNEAKSNGNYQDQTANLRNSIGYVIADNGVIMEENFSATAQGVKPSKEDPIKYGKTLAKEVAKSYGEISLIVVSGMRYGVFVESKGFNVLTSAEQFAKSYLSNLLNELKK